MVDLILNTLLAALCVFGGYCLVWLLSASLFRSKAIVTAIVLQTEADLETLPTLLCEAEEMRFGHEKERVVLLVSEELYRDAGIRDELKALAAAAEVMICPTVGYLDDPPETTTRDDPE